MMIMFMLAPMAMVHVLLPCCANGDDNAMDSFLQHHEDDHPGFEEFHV
jgi:hypothetical protein